MVFVPFLLRTSLRPLLQTRSSSSCAIVSYVCVQLLFEWFRRQCTLYLRLQKLSCLVPSANSGSKQKLITKRCRNAADCNSVSNELIYWKQETTNEEKMHRKESDRYICPSLTVSFPLEVIIGNEDACSHCRHFDDDNPSLTLCTEHATTRIDLLLSKRSIHVYKHADALSVIGTYKAITSCC